MNHHQAFASRCTPISTALAACLALVAVVMRVIVATQSREISWPSIDVTFWSVGDMAYSTAVSVLQKVFDNQMVQALVVSAAFAAICYLVREVYNFVSAKVKGLFFSTIAIKNTDENFNTILDFISEKCVREDSPAMIATSKKRKLHWRKAYIEYLNGASEASKMDYRPEENTAKHFVYRDSTILMFRRKGQTLTVGWSREPKQLETLHLSTWGWSNQILKDLFDEALQEKVKEERSGLNIYVQGSDWPYGWTKALSKRPRDRNSVILDGNLADDLLDDARSFLCNRQWYDERHIPYRRGYLLYGPPGTGKTSFAQVIAAELSLNICMLSLCDSKMDDAGLAREIREAPKNAMIMLEDVDAVFVDRAKQEGMQNQVTFSGLLNAIDGVGSQEGRIFVMTTNHIERLDPALIRPGRCDVKAELRKSSKNQMERIFLRFFPEANQKGKGNGSQAKAFAANLPEFEISMAQLQGFLMKHRKSPADALENLGELLRLEGNETDESVDDISLNPFERMTVREHFHRLGLESLAPVFLEHGYRYRDEIFADKDLKFDLAKHFSLELKYDSKLSRRLSLLMGWGKDAEKKPEYQLVSVPQVRESFLLTFSTGQEARDALTLEHTEHLSRQADAFTRALTGKESSSIISKWRLAEILELESNCPQACVDHARAFAKLKKEGSAAGTPTPADMTVWQFMKRAGFANTTFAHQLEEEGYTLARSLKGLDEQEFKKIGIGHGDDDAKLRHIIKLINAKDEDSIDLRAMALADQAILRKDFRKAFPSATNEEVRSFSHSLFDHYLNRGKVSLKQLRNFLGSLGTDATPTNAMDGIASLLEPEKKKPAPIPARPEPTHWVYRWCKGHNLEDVAANFSDHDMHTREDIFAEPMLTEEDLKAIGIDKLGIRRRLLRIIECERRGEATSALDAKRAGMPPMSPAMTMTTQVREGEAAPVISLD